MNFFKELMRQFQKFLLSLKKHYSPRIPIKIFLAEFLFLVFYYKSYMVITSAVICPINLDSLQSYLFTFTRNWFKVIAAISNYGIFRDKIKFSHKHKKRYAHICALIMRFSNASQNLRARGRPPPLLGLFPINHKRENQPSVKEKRSCFVGGVRAQ